MQQDKKTDIFVVDDDEDFAEFVAQVAEEAGFRPTIYTNARDCFQALQQEAPVALIMDVVMPNMDGIELLSNLSGKVDQLPIIAMSGYDQQYLKVIKTLGEANGLRIVATLMKPFTSDKLEAALADIRSGNGA